MRATRTRRGRSRKALLLARVVMTTILILSLGSFLLVSNKLSPSAADKKQRTVMVHRPVLILDNTKQEQAQAAAAASIKQKNALQKPFQWYRDHWYPPRHQTQQQQQAKPVWGDTSLPVWMKEYFAWHKAQTTASAMTYGGRRDDNNHSNSNHHSRYLILQCLEQDRQCGGLADRLLALPFLVLLAAQSQRQLIIVWTIPFPLEEFLMPPPGGVDWMLPSSSGDDLGLVSQDAILLAPSLIDKTVFVRVSSLVEAVQDASLPVVRARIQDYASAWEYYDQYHYGEKQPDNETTTPSFALQHFRDLFFVLFQPSPPLAQVMKENQLFTALTGREVAEEHPYAVAHYRALYGSQQSPSMAYMEAAANNALNCASQLLPGGPVVFLSDSAEAARTIRQQRSRHTKDSIQNKQVLLRSNNTTASTKAQPLHLDKATRQRQQPTTATYEPSDFYDTFLDLFLMAKARCVSFGQGGFGKMGSLLSHNRTCTNRHFEHGRMVPCVWKN